MSFMPGTASQLEKPARKKRRLEFTKCGDCRRDKQKCLPVERQFPAKCFRCTQKGFSCSEGRRARMKAVSEPIHQIIPPELIVTADRPRYGLNGDSRDWLLLISYYKNMQMAMKCLHRILEETDILFFGEHSDEEDEPDLLCSRWTLASQEGSDFEKFHRVFNKLSSVVQATSVSMVMSNKPEDLRSAISTLRFQVLWNKVQTPDKECIHCTELVDGQSILEEIHQLENPAAEFVFRLAIRDYTGLYRLKNDIDTLHGLHKEVQSKCQALLRYHDLYDAMPSISQRHTLYYPESFAMYCALEGEVVPVHQLDCLGRTQYHHFLDHGADGSFIMLVYNTRMGSDRSKTQPDFDKSDILGRTPLHVACHKTNLDMVRTLLSFGADVNRKTMFGSQPLHYAAARGSKEICEALLDTNGIDVNAIDERGCTALAYATRKKHSKIVKLLLSKDLGNHADPNVFGTHCRPPLIEGIVQEDEHIVRHLLTAGANPGVEFNGDNAFLLATLKENIQIMSLLANRMPKHLLNKPGRWLYTPLMTAVRDEFTEGAIFIIGLTGVDLNARDINGITPLMVAAETRQYKVVKELLKKSTIDVSVTDNENRKAADYARRGGHRITTDLIELHEKSQ